MKRKAINYSNALHLVYDGTGKAIRRTAGKLRWLYAPRLQVDQTGNYGPEYPISGILKLKSKDQQSETEI